MTAYDRLRLTRQNHRPTGADFVAGIFTDKVELHGDRRFGDDDAIIGGVGMLDGRPVTYIAIDKGHDLQERMKKNFGCPKPEGYRKALRLMKQAEKFGRPVICFVDTQGAFCGADAEERGQGEAIAENILEMMGLGVPAISIVIGEGGSGGALALASSDRVYMLENAVYSVISPEGCASILWKDAGTIWLTSRLPTVSFPRISSISTVCATTSARLLPPTSTGSRSCRRTSSGTADTRGSADSVSSISNFRSLIIIASAPKGAGLF